MMSTNEIDLKNRGSIGKGTSLTHQSSLMKVRTISELRYKLASENNYFCPYTKNKKFEAFIRHP